MGVEGSTAGGHEAAMLLFLLGEGLDMLDRGHAPMDQRVDLAVGVARRRGDQVDLAVEHADQHGQQRHDDQRHGGEHRIDRDHHQQHPDQHHQRLHDRQQPVHHHGLHREAVRGDAHHQVADLLPAVEGQRQALQMRIEPGAQIVDHALAEADREPIVDQVERTGSQHDQHQRRAQHGGEGELRPALRSRQPVDRLVA